MKFDRAMLFGRWFRHDINNNNEKTIEYALLNPDGSFEFTFLTYEMQSDHTEKIVEKIIELGDWGLVADIHFTITKNELIGEQLYAADLCHRDNYHAYRVLQLDHAIFKYQHIESNEIYIMRKITDDKGYC